MSFGYTTINGERVETHVAADFARMDAEFYSITGYHLVINSGTRTRAEQEYLYNGWINRLPGFNLAAPPGKSNHEENGPIGPRALDLSDTGADAGVMTIGSYRSNVLVQIAPKHNFKNAGHFFNPREAWHYEWTGSFSAAAGGYVPGTPIDEKVLREQQFLNAARGEALVPDGQYGAATKAAYERYQIFLRDNYDYKGEIDGIWGDGTQAAHARYYEVWSKSTAPAYPLAPGEYFGPEAGGDQSISGYHSHRADLKAWQARMAERGWEIIVDGYYGVVGQESPGGNTYDVALAFQKEKGLTADGLIGPETWGAAWTAPITNPNVPTTPTMPTNPPIPVVPKSPDNPRGLSTYTPIYPGAYIGLDAPLGDGPRGFKGEDNTVVPKVIDQFHIHRTGTAGDDGDWFSYRNSRSSCPHLHILTDGRVREFIKPEFKPALTGPEWNWRGYGVEIQGAGDGNSKQFEAVADAMAWLASFEGKELRGVPVKYNLRSRANTTLTHREMIPGTECPGDWWQGQIDALIVRAREILATKYAPVEPPKTITVPLDWFLNLEAETGATHDEIRRKLVEAGVLA